MSEILRSASAAVPKPERPEKLADHLDLVRELYSRCKGNIVRVQEELAAAGVDVPYSTVTGFCRRHGIGKRQKERAGRYHLEPGEEMQHDTSPHTVEIGGRKRVVQCTSIVLAYCRRIYVQCYPTYNRFYAKAFLTEAFQWWQGLAARAVIDNTSVVLAHGSGKGAVPAPEMAAFADRFGFEWMACEINDPDRKGRVERPFHYIEHNFYPGRTFADLVDLNDQLRTWCEKLDHKPRRHLQARPIELFAAEQPALKPLPLHVPEVYALHRRTVDLEGFVHLHTNAYSVPDAIIGREVDVRETLTKVRIVHRHEVIAEHARFEEGANQSRTLPEHAKKRHARHAPPPIPEEATLRAAAVELGVLIDRIRARHGGRAVRSVRHLHRMFIDYPTDALVAGIVSALEYNQLDLDAIERIVLRRIAGDFFRQPPDIDDGR